MGRDTDIISYKDYLSCFRSILIAPAGHGKTTAIADCILQCPEQSCYLILTHTHAGITSLRKKLNENKINTKRYRLDTITSYAQNLVLSFLGTSNLPPQEDKSYFKDIITECTRILSSSVIQTIIKLSYDGIFIDEFQDCTKDQFSMILSLGANIPIHLLGDPLQGIFDFGSSLVNFTDDIKDFTVYDLLKHPWRWDKTNPQLGAQILQIRNLLLNNREIDLNYYDAIHIEKYPEGINEYDPKYLKWLRDTISKYDNDSFLIIYPYYNETIKGGKYRKRGFLTDRIKLKSKIYSNRFVILDALDNPEYYRCAKFIDTCIINNKSNTYIKSITDIILILRKLYIESTSISEWIDQKRKTFINKVMMREKSTQLIELFNKYRASSSVLNLFSFIDYFIKLPGIKCKFKEFYWEMKRASIIAITYSISLFDAIARLKNTIRRVGRNIDGRYIGSTLLTKGLEFDTVIICHADKFEDAKNFYVAISRASRNLVLLMDNTIVHFSASLCDHSIINQM